MTIRCFGGISVESGSRVPKLGSSQAKLIAALVAAGRSGLSPDQLLEDLYGHDIPTSGRQSLYQLVARSKSHLDGALVNQNGRYQLDLPESAVDLWKFRRQTRSLSQSNFDRSALLNALALWSGAPYGDVDMTNRLRVDAAELGIIRSRAALAVAETIDSDRNSVDERLVLTAVNDDPLNERLASAAASALYRAGRQTAALAVIRQCRSALRDELGLVAGSALEATELAILRHDKALLRTGGTIRPGPSSPSEVGSRVGPFVGRQTELQSLFDSFAHVEKGGPGRVVVVEGPGGAGKSSLVKQTATSLTSRGHTVRIGTAGSGGEAAYEPFAKALPEITEDLDLLEAHENRSVGRLRFWQKISHRLSDLVHERGPTLLILDDMHLADSQSCQLLSFLVSAALPSGLLIVASARPPETKSSWNETLHQLRDSPISTLLILAPFGSSEVQQLVDHHFPNRPPSRRRVFAEQLHRLSGGNAYVVASTCSAHADLADLSTGASPLPVSFDGSMVRSRVEPKCAKLLGAAAVIGVEFSFELLLAITNVDRSTALDHLESAMQAGLVLEDRSTTGSFRFDHLLTAAAFADGLSATRSAAIMADLAQRDDLDDGRRVRYVHGAGSVLPHDVSIPILERAATALEEASLFVEAGTALSEWRHALQEASEATPTRLLVQQASIAAWAGEDDKARQFRDEAFEVASDASDHDAMAQSAMAGLPQADVANGDTDRLSMFAQIDAGRLAVELRPRFYAAWITQARLCEDLKLAKAIFVSIDKDDFEGQTIPPEVRLAELYVRGTACSPVPVLNDLRSFASSLPMGSLRAEARHRELLASIVEHGPETEQLFNEVLAEVLEFGAPQTRYAMEVTAVTLAAAGIRNSTAEPGDGLAAGYRFGIRDAFDNFGAQVWLDMYLTGQAAAAIGLIDAASDGITSNVAWRGAAAVSAAAGGDAARAEMEMAAICQELDDFPDVKWNIVAAALLVDASILINSPESTSYGYEILLPHSGQSVVLGGPITAYLGPADFYLAKAERLLGRSGFASRFDDALTQVHQLGAKTWIGRIEEEGTAQP